MEHFPWRAKIETPFRMCANPYYDNDKKKVKAIETSEILFSCLRFLVNALQDLFYSQNSGGKINLKTVGQGSSSLRVMGY